MNRKRKGGSNHLKIINGGEEAVIAQEKMFYPEECIKPKRNCENKLLVKSHTIFLVRRLFVCTTIETHHRNG